MNHDHIVESVPMDPRGFYFLVVNLDNLLRHWLAWLQSFSYTSEVNKVILDLAGLRCFVNVIFLVIIFVFPVN